MAMIKTSGLITGIVGNVNGSTFQPWRGGTMMRTTGKPLRNQSNHVQEKKQQFGAVKSYWSNMTQAEREAWSAAAGNFPKTSKAGIEYTPSGYQFFMSCALITQNYADRIVTAPPTENKALVTNSGEEIEIVGDQPKKIVVGWDADARADQQLMEISISKPVPSGRSLRPSNWRSVKTALFSATSADITQEDITTALGFVPSGDCVMFFRFRVIDAEGGFIGTPVFLRSAINLDDEPAA